MGSMTDERRKEMEEEMMRFEQEIAFPSDKGGSEKKSGQSPPSPPPPPGKSEHNLQDLKKQKITPLPPPPILNVLPSVLGKPPPPPPELSCSIQQRPILPAPPPPPPVNGEPGSCPPMRFIPHQLMRHAPRLPHRPNMMPMRPHHPHPDFPHGPMMHPFPGPMQEPFPYPMPMHPMGMHMPIPHGFCPPPPGIMNHMPNMNMHPQPFIPPSLPQYNEPIVTTSSISSKESKSMPPVASAPAIYAAPPMKSQSDRLSEIVAALNGQPIMTENIISVAPKVEEVLQVRSSNDVVAPAAVPVSASAETPTTKKKEKKKKNIRMAGGQAWEDNSLAEWESDDFRIFCGDLGNDVTDEVLIRAFSKYQSFVKAKVIRDKRTNKTKGFGFVSFKDPQDFIKAMREMNGRYVGSRPIKLRKSTWKDRNIEVVRKKQKEKEKLGLL